MHRAVVPAVLATLLAVPHATAQPPAAPGGTNACGPGDTRPVCQAARATIQPAQPVAPQPLPHHPEDLLPKRYVPPAIIAFLSDRRIDPLTRAFLRTMAGKETADWTLSEYWTVTSLVPTLAETNVPTRDLSAFYEFLGLDPASLFEPTLRNTWQQKAASAFSANDLSATQRAQCLALLGFGQTLDPSEVTLGAMAACAGKSY